MSHRRCQEERALLRGLFVTGTDTGVGKTVSAAALLHRLVPGTYPAPHRQVPGTYPAPNVSKGIPGEGAKTLRYWKPIQTGIEQDDDSAEVRRLGGAGFDVYPNGIRLPKPLSPHLSARLANTRIALDPLVNSVLDEPASVRWIVEGAGGVLVPINERDLMIDLMKRLQLPALVVARSGLGTINHTLLTLEALRVRGLTIAGVLMVGEPNRENREAIEHYGAATVVGEMPRLNPLTAETLGEWADAHLDPAGHLLEALV